MAIKAVFGFLIAVFIIAIIAGIGLAVFNTQRGRRSRPGVIIAIAGLIGILLLSPLNAGLVLIQPNESGVVFRTVGGGSEEQRAAAAQLGLLLAPDVPVQRSERTTETPAPPVEAVAPGALVIDRPLRSGQQVYARGRDLVLLAMVNHGAEVIADGHVHVYAPLRGRAIAGARGNTEARIFSTCMEPQLVSIAGIYRTTETALPAQVLGKPAQVRLEGEKLRIEPL